jgi:hypothetical protein
MIFLLAENSQRKLANKDLTFMYIRTLIKLTSQQSRSWCFPYCTQSHNLGLWSPEMMFRFYDLLRLCSATFRCQLLIILYELDSQGSWWRSRLLSMLKVASNIEEWAGAVCLEQVLFVYKTTKSKGVGRWATPGALRYAKLQLGLKLSFNGDSSDWHQHPRRPLDT